MSENKLVPSTKLLEFLEISRYTIPIVTVQSPELNDFLLWKAVLQTSTTRNVVVSSDRCRIVACVEWSEHGEKVLWCKLILFLQNEDNFNAGCDRLYVLSI